MEVNADDKIASITDILTEVEKTDNTADCVNTTTKKKKPGRPKKKIEILPVLVCGIVDKPYNNNSVLELVYRNPLLFAKLMRLYKQYEVSEVEMRFNATGIKMITKDHIGKSNIYANIDGNAMDSYYCKQPMRVCVKRINLEHILSSLGKNHTKITIVSKEDSYRSVMFLIINDTEYNNEDQYEIDVSYNECVEDGDNADDDSLYPIKFSITSKYFKSRINQIKKFSDTFIIQKGGNDNLQITFNKTENINWVGVYNDPEKIGLVSTITDNDAFSVGVCIDYVRPFSNSNIGDIVHIAAHKTEKISFSTMLDKNNNGYACHVKIFTDIKI